MIREVKKRSRGAKFLSHEQHGCFRSKQRQCRNGAVTAFAGHLVRSLSMQAVGNLIMVVCENDEGAGGFIGDLRAARLLLPFVILALIEESAFDAGNQLLRFASIICVVSFS